MEYNKLPQRMKLSAVFLLILFLFYLEPAPTKVKVIVDNSSIKETPEIGGKTLAHVSLNTILEAEVKQGEWYKVNLEQEGVLVSGFIHEMLVEIVREEEITEQTRGILIGRDKPQPELLAEIEFKIEENRKLIIQKTDFEMAINSLRSLIAKAFKIDDNQRQRELAAETYLLIGLAYAGQGERYLALREIRNMFEVNYAHANEIVRNIYDPEIISLIKQAENEFLGRITEYSLEISTVPKEAMIRIDGQEIGLSPEVYRTSIPKFQLEIKKAGYNLISEEIFLTQAVSKKEYVLISSGREVDIRSSPSGAKVYLDGQDTEKLTDCLLPRIPFGFHTIKIVKENYTEWEKEVEIAEGEEPVVVEVVLNAKRYEYFKKWGGPDRKIFLQPKGIAFDKEDNIYVVDNKGDKIKKFNPEGRFLANWGSSKRELRGMKEPTGIAIDDQGYIYVTDARANVVWKFDKNGTYINKWGREGSGKDELNRPMGIAVDGNNDVYVVDSENFRIKKYARTGDVGRIWGQQGASDGNFVYPTAVAVNQKNEVFVVDRMRVQKFSLKGEFISSWGQRGIGDGAMNVPMGIGIDFHNNVYVVDSGNNRIQKFDEEGSFISKWGSSGIGSGQMSFPFGIAINNQGHVFITERDNHRVQVFRILSEAKNESAKNISSLFPSP